MNRSFLKIHEKLPPTSVSESLADYHNKFAEAGGYDQGRLQTINHYGRDREYAESLQDFELGPPRNKPHGSANSLRSDSVLTRPTHTQGSDSLLTRPTHSQAATYYNYVEDDQSRVQHISDQP